MKKIALFLLFGVLLSAGVMAQPINLLEEGTSMRTKAIENNAINENIIYELNNNIYINAMTEGYNSVGIQIEEQFYHISITNNSIDAIHKLDEPIKTDYTLQTDFPEILYVYANHQTMPKTEIMRTLIMDKDIPLKVVYRFVALLMRGN